MRFLNKKHLGIAIVGVTSFVCAGLAFATTTNMSLDSSGTQATNSSYNPIISSNGRYVVYMSDATNLVAGDTNGVVDIFMRDRQTNTTTRVNVSTTGVQTNATSTLQAVSSDGRFITFGSDATNLVPGDTNGMTDVFVRDTLLNTTIRASLGNTGVEPNNLCAAGYSTDDGRYTIFMSHATNLVTGDVNGGSDVFLRDNILNTTTLVSRDSLGAQLNSGVNSVVGVSDDANYVYFNSIDNNVTSGDIYGTIDMFVRNISLGTTTHVAKSYTGADIFGIFGIPSLTSDGTRVLFNSTSNVIVTGDTNGLMDTFMYDAVSGITTRVSVGNTGAEANAYNVIHFSNSLSKNGRFVGFVSIADNLVLGDTNVLADVFIRDTLLGTTKRALTSSNVQNTSGFPRAPSISNQGQLAFQSAGLLWTTGDANGFQDIFFYDPTSTIITITAPTKLLNVPITDTTISVYDPFGVNATGVTIDPSSTANPGSLICTQSGATYVNCTVVVNNSGKLVIAAENIYSESTTKTELGYIVDTVAPAIPSVAVDTLTPYNVNDPQITFSTTDNIAVDYCEIYYTLDNYGTGTATGSTLLTPATSPVVLDLDPDEILHTILVRCYDTAGNSSDNIVAFPPLITFITPTQVSGTDIIDAQFSVLSPLGNDIDNINISASTIPGAFIGSCIGSGGDLVAPYASPVVCDLGGITAGGDITLQAEDISTLAVGQNTQAYIIDPVPPSVVINAPTKVLNTGITDTTIDISDASYGIYVTGVYVDPSTTAAYTGFSCIQQTFTDITCTITILDDGDLVIAGRDIAGNVTTTSEVGYIVDNTTPVVTFIDDVSVGPVTGEAITITATDDIQIFIGSLAYGFSTDAVCDATDDYSYSPYTSGSGFIIATAAYNGQYVCAQALDHVLNATYTRSTNVLNVDLVPPVLTLVGGSPVAVALGGTYTESGATWVDNLLTGFLPTPSSGSVNTAVLGTYILTYTHADALGNIGTVTRTVNVVDLTPPVATLNGSGVVTVAHGSVYIDSGATWTDNVDGSGVITAASSGVVNTGLVGSYTLHYRYVDAGGNTSNIVTRTVNVTDQTPPVVTVLGSSPLTVAHGSVYVDSGATWTDNVDGTGMAAIISGSVDTATLGTYILIYRHTDTGGNISTVATRTVHVTDQTAPVVALVGTSSITIPHGVDYIDSGATWTDAIDGTGTATLISGSVNTGVVGTYTLTYRHTDTAGNTGNTVTRTIIVTDQTPPAVTLSGSATGTVAQGGIYTEAGATWTDAVDGSGFIAVAYSGSVNTAVVGVYTLSYRYIDAGGNTGNTVTRVITVTDQTAPVVTLSGSATGTIAYGSVYTEAGATWTDNVDGVGFIPTAYSGSVNTSLTGVYTLSYRYIDAGGNTGNTVTRVITVTDQTAPVVTLLGNSPLTIAQGSIYVDSGALWTDNAEGTGMAAIISGSVNTSLLGTYILTYRHTDGAGNTGNTVTRTVHVTDQTAPVVTLVAGPSTVLQGSVYTDPGATWIDNIDGTGIIAIATTGTVDTATLGTYILTYQYVDAAGNTGSTTRTIIVSLPSGGYGGGGGGGGTPSVTPILTGNAGTGVIATGGTTPTGETGTIGGGSGTINPLSEMETAYQFAFRNDITTLSYVKSMPYGQLLRKDLAKMISNFAINVLGRQPDESRREICTQYVDKSIASPETWTNIVKSCMLSVMGQKQDGITPLQDFMSEKVVTRAEFGTVLSRALWGRDNDNNADNRYIDHLQALKDSGYMKYITDSRPFIVENRGYAWTVFMRVAQNAETYK